MEETRARSIANEFKIRASATAEICAGEIGLSEKQTERMKELKQRAIDFKNGVPKVKDLTDNMKAELSGLIIKELNPELPEGAKTHCKKWIKEKLYGRRAELKNKYVTKGNEQEDEGFTIMAVNLKLGMVKKNEEYRENDYSCGTCDLDDKTTGHDNKCSWDLSTFPMFETELPDLKYWWQLQNYAIRYPHWTDLSLCYTLVNSSQEEIKKAIKWTENEDEIYKIVERMIYDRKEFDRLKSIYFPLSSLDTFIEIPEANRVKQFLFKPDTKAQETIKTRAYMCKDYIYSLLIAMK